MAHNGDAKIGTTAGATSRESQWFKNAKSDDAQSGNTVVAGTSGGEFASVSQPIKGHPALDEKQVNKLIDVLLETDNAQMRLTAQKILYAMGQRQAALAGRTAVDPLIMAILSAVGVDEKKMSNAYSCLEELSSLLFTS